MVLLEITQVSINIACATSATEREGDRARESEGKGGRGRGREDTDGVCPPPNPLLGGRGTTISAPSLEVTKKHKKNEVERRVVGFT